MLLLTDVGDSDQHMSYVIGSHKLMHPYEMFFKNPCTLDYVRGKMGNGIEIYDAVGRAGDVFIFDTNGAHRGNRKEGSSIRDVYLVEYSADRAGVWGSDIAPRVLESLDADSRAIFDRMLSAPRLWERTPKRIDPTWAETVTQPETWL